MAKKAAATTVAVDPSQKVSRREAVAIAVRKVGAQGVTTFMSSFGTVFLTEAYFAKYAYASVAGTIGVISGVSVIFGCLMNMVAGILMYKLKLKGGKYRPWVLLSALPILLYGFAFFFTPSDMSVDGLIALRWVVVLLGTGIGSFVTQSDNILQVISGSDKEKKKMININSIMNYVGYGGVYVFYEIFGSLKNASMRFLLVVAVFAVIRVIGDILTYAFCRERIHFSEEPVKLTSAGLQPLKYRPFLTYNLAVWVRALLGVTGIVMATFCQCTVGSKNMLLVTLPSAVGTVVGLLIFLLLTKKFQAVRIIQCSGVYVITMALILGVIGFSVNWYDKTIAGNEAYIAAYGEALDFAHAYEEEHFNVKPGENEEIILGEISVVRLHEDGTEMTEKEEKDAGNNFHARFVVKEENEAGELVAVKEFEPVAHVETATLLPVLFYIFYFLFGFYFGVETIGYEHLKMETFDYLEWKMHQRVEVMAGVVPSWIQNGLDALKKFLIPAVVMVWLGFQNAVVDKNSNTVLTVAENIARAGENSYNTTCRSVLLVATVTTAVGALIAAGILAFYGLNKAKKEEMYAALAVMRAEREADAK